MPLLIESGGEVAEGVFLDAEADVAAALGDQPVGEDGEITGWGAEGEAFQGDGLSGEGGFAVDGVAPVPSWAVGFFSVFVGIGRGGGFRGRFTVGDQADLFALPLGQQGAVLERVFGVGQLVGEQGVIESGIVGGA